MQIPAFIHRKLQQFANKTINSRDADFIVGDKATPYLHRWFVIPRNPFFNIYLHKFYKSDDDRALHDHPWMNISILVEGNYFEVQNGKPKHFDDPVCRIIVRQRASATPVMFYRQERFVYVRLPKTAHRIQLTISKTTEKEIPCVTLFITGPRIREWGFLCPNGWRNWKEFTSPKDKGLIGKGCEE